MLWYLYWPDGDVVHVFVVHKDSVATVLTLGAVVPAHVVHRHYLQIALTAVYLYFRFIKTCCFCADLFVLWFLYLWFIRMLWP